MKLPSNVTVYEGGRRYKGEAPDRFVDKKAVDSAQSILDKQTKKSAKPEVKAEPKAEPRKEELSGLSEKK